MKPSSAGEWLRWAHNTVESFRNPHSVQYGSTGGGDWRMSDRRETALSVVRIAERMAGGPKAVRLLFAFHVHGSSGHSFTINERVIIRAATKRFEAALRRVGFLPARERGAT